jgi:hypothetical protein
MPIVGFRLLKICEQRNKYEIMDTHITHDAHTSITSNGISRLMDSNSSKIILIFVSCWQIVFFISEAREVKQGKI